MVKHLITWQRHLIPVFGADGALIGQVPPATRCEVAEAIAAGPVEWSGQFGVMGWVRMSVMVEEVITAVRSAANDAEPPVAVMAL